MRSALPRIALVVVLALVGALLLYRAVNGGGPLLYFGSAVFFGMAWAALSSVRRRPPGS